MTRPQPGILTAEESARYFLEYSLRAATDGAAMCRAVHAALGDGPGSTETTTTVAFGPRALTAMGRDVGLRAFAAVEGSRHRAPSTQRDLWFGVQGDAHDAVFDRVLSIQRGIGVVADLELDLRGFDYRNSHDLIGFEDGTANPKGEDAIAAAVVPDGRRGGGGSYVFTQQWVHDLAAFEDLSVAEQEAIVGRTKADSIELEGDAMPVDSHVSRTDAKVDGISMKILRRSSPYGSATSHGLYFLAYACELRRFQVQLERMYGVSGDGLSDRLVDFSTAITGSYWYAPSAEALLEMLKMPEMPK